MPNEIQQRALIALAACLRPLARVLLRSGINYLQFADAAKDAFVVEAHSERDSRGRQANTSRIAVRTGISRKEVARIRNRSDAASVDARSAASMSSHSGHAARTLQLWHTDERYVDGTGKPRDLPFSGDEPSFANLVRIVGGDIPPGAVRAELVAAGAVVETDQGLVRPLKRHFVPGDVGEELVVGLEHIVHPVLLGLARNTGPSRKDPFLQRVAYSDRVLPAAVPGLRQMAQVKCEEFIQSMDDWLCANETGCEVEAGDRTRMGIGVFYFEEGSPD